MKQITNKMADIIETNNMNNIQSIVTRDWNEKVCLSCVLLLWLKISASFFFVHVAMDWSESLFEARPIVPEHFVASLGIMVDKLRPPLNLQIQKF